jgi:hypothetical protein
VHVAAASPERAAVDPDLESWSVNRLADSTVTADDLHTLQRMFRFALFRSVSGSRLAAHVDRS